MRKSSAARAVPRLTHAKLAKPKKAKAEPKLESKWYAIANSMWNRVSPEKKAKYVKLHRTTLKERGEKFPKHGYKNAAPSNFVRRIATGEHPAGYKSLVAEFPELRGDLYKAFKTDLRKGHKVKKGIEAHIEHAAMNVASRMATKPGSLEAHQRVARTRGDKAHHGLANFVGVHHAEVKALAQKHKSPESFHAAAVQKWPKLKTAKAEHVHNAFHTARSYENSTEAPDMKKALDTIQKALSHDGTTLGHTATGKPVKVAGKYHGSFSKEDHEDAADIHDAIARKLENASSRWDGSMPSAARRAIEKHAKHHRAQSQAHRSEGYKIERSANGGMGAEVAQPSQVKLADTASFKGGEEPDLAKAGAKLTWKQSGAMAGAHHAGALHGNYQIIPHNEGGHVLTYNGGSGMSTRSQARTADAHSRSTPGNVLGQSRWHFKGSNSKTQAMAHAEKHHVEMAKVTKTPAGRPTSWTRDSKSRVARKSLTPERREMLVADLAANLSKATGSASIFLSKVSPDCNLHGVGASAAASFVPATADLNLAKATCSCHVADKAEVAEYIVKGLAKPDTFAGLKEAVAAAKELGLPLDAATIESLIDDEES